MSLNLWKMGGKPTSYSPLPFSLTALPIGIGDFIFNFTVANIGSNSFRIGGDNPNLKVEGTGGGFNVNQNGKYSLKISNSVPQNLYFNNFNSASGIQIDSIELVQKPLPKLTINGIDGFLSGKWSLHANAKVIDDETLVLNATASQQHNKLKITVPMGVPMTLSVSGENPTGYRVYVHPSDTLNPFSGGYGLIDETKTDLTFTPTSDTVWVYLTSSTSSGQFTFKRPMLNLGSTPVPYEKKRGERMVLPTAKKNLFDGALEYGRYDPSTGVKVSQPTGIRSANYMSVKPNSDYSFSKKSYELVSGQADSFWVVFYDMNKAIINFTSALNVTFKTPNNCYFVTFYIANAVQSANNLLTNIQLEQGSTTPYEPYAVQVNKKPKKSTVKSKTGLSFNGVSDYLQLPSMTMDSVEIDCLVDSVQPNAGNHKIIEARTGLANGWVELSSNGTLNYGVGWSSVTGLKTNERTKIKAIASSVFTDDIILFRFNSANSDFTKGTLYKITCYLNGSIVAQYDFENNKTVVGNQVLQNPVNLIPSFEDGRWSLHANTQVLGKDVLRLNATGSNQASRIYIDCLPSQKYKNIVGVNGGVVEVAYFDSNNSLISFSNVNSTGILDQTTPSNAKQIRFTFYSNGSGTFEFIRPQLYQLDGKEGTVNGAPSLTRKARRRNLYAKR